MTDNDFPHPYRVRDEDMPEGWTIPLKVSMTSDHQDEIHFNGTLVAVFGRDMDGQSYARVLVDDPECKLMVKEAVETGIRRREARERAESWDLAQKKAKRERQIADSARRALKGKKT